MSSAAKNNPIDDEIMNVITINAKMLYAKLPHAYADVLIELDDLISAGVVGALRAKERYEGSRGASFRTYAITRIRGAMLDELRRWDWLPRRIGSNTAYGLSKASMYVNRIEDKDIEHAGVDVDDMVTTLYREDFIKRFQALIKERLNQDERTIFLAFHVDELSLKEISKILFEGRFSSERVCQIRRQGEKKIARSMADYQKEGVPYE